MQSMLNIFFAPLAYDKKTFKKRQENMLFYLSCICGLQANQSTTTEVYGNPFPPLNLKKKKYLRLFIIQL